MVVGLLLAAGAGRRAGGPKALRVDADGTSWLLRSGQVLLDGGCERVVIVLGAAAAEARLLLDHGWPAELRAGLTVVEADDWALGMGESLRAGLRTVGVGQSVCVHLVDLPDVTASVLRRLLAVDGPSGLVRAAYDGSPGHPVLIGPDHLAAITAGLIGDRGAQDYLDRHGVELVECGDLAGGADHDR